MKYFHFRVTTQYDSYEWSQDWLVQGETIEEAQKKAENFNYTHFDDWKDELPTEYQEVDTLKEISKEHFDLLTENHYINEIWEEDSQLETHTLGCKYCGKVHEWTFEPDGDFEDMDDIIKYDFETMCPHCHCPIRVNESLVEQEGAQI